MTFPNTKIYMLILGLLLWASLLSIVEAIPVDGNSLKRVRWGVNRERLYRLPEGLALRSIAETKASLSDLESEKSCTCGHCGACRTKKMLGEESQERLFGFGSQSYYDYNPYGSALGYDPYYSSYDPYYSQYYEPSYGIDPYYSNYNQYPHYW